MWTFMPDLTTSTLDKRAWLKGHQGGRADSIRTFCANSTPAGCDAGRFSSVAAPYALSCQEGTSDRDGDRSLCASHGMVHRVPLDGLTPSLTDEAHQFLA